MNDDLSFLSFKITRLSKFWRKSIKKAIQKAPIIEKSSVSEAIRLF